MNIRLLTVLATTGFLTVVSVARSDDSIPGIKAAPGVAEMLQRRQESQVREQLVKEGRWDAARKIDEEQALRQRERQQRTVAQMNEELARNAKADAPAISATATGGACEESSKVR